MVDKLRNTICHFSFALLFLQLCFAGCMEARNMTRLCKVWKKILSRMLMKMNPSLSSRHLKTKDGRPEATTTVLPIKRCNFVEASPMGELQSDRVSSSGGNDVENGEKCGQKKEVEDGELGSLRWLRRNGRKREADEDAFVGDYSNR